MAAKYYVWGEGLWREVDVASGRVSGWRRRARFVFVRRGRLLVARRRPVLRALKALAAGQPSAAADGARLPHRSKSESRKHKHEPPAPPAPPARGHQCCCIHNGCHNHGGQLLPAPAPAPPALAPPAPSPAPPALAFPEAPSRSDAGTQCARDSATSTERAVKQTNTHAPGPASSAPAVTVQDSSSADDFVSKYVRRPPPASTNTDVSSLLGKPASTAAARDKKHSPARTRADQSGVVTAKQARARARPVVVSEHSSSSSSEEGVPPSRKAHAAVKELVVSDADVAVLRGFVARTRPRALPRFDADDAYKRALFYAINPLVELERCERLEHMLAARAFAARLGLVPSPAPSSPARAARHRRSEPRSYREGSGSSDTDKENKGKHSSPNKVRSEPLSVMKQSAPPRAGVSERASPRVGVSEHAPPRAGVSGRAPPRAGVAERAPLRAGVSERASSRAVVSERASPRAGVTERALPRAGVSERAPLRAGVFERASPRTGVSERASPRTGVSERSNKSNNKKQVAPIKAPQTSGVASDALKAKHRSVSAPAPDNKKPAAVSDDSRVAPFVVRHVISQRASRANAKEYSNMEDHAIVAWLSTGSRASLVGGNRVWRDLEEQFQRLTGRGRSWHSLRNRYLRYILPGLGALHLPPADASRLRAAAATGVLKSKNRPQPGPAPAPPSPQLRAFRRPRLLSSGAEDDSDGPPPAKRRSLRTRPLDSSSKDDSAKESPPKASASKETSTKDESSKESAKASVRKAVNSKETSNKDESSKESPRKASTSKESSAKESSSKESPKAAGGKKVGSAAAGSKARRSPRYSEVTRRFAARHRRPASSSATSRSSRSPSPVLAPRPPPRSRRLYNPNANV